MMKFTGESLTKRGESMKIRISKEVLPGLPLVEVSTRENVGAFFRRLGKKRGESCQIRLISEKTEDSKHLLESAVCALYDGAYQFRKETLKKLDRNSIYEMRDLLTDFGETEYTFITEQICEEEGKEAIRRGSWLGKVKGYARTLGNLPNNYLHTEEMVTYAEKVAKDCKMTCRVLGDRELKEMGAGGILAVNQGSRREAAMVVLEYEGAAGEEKIGLVGKGLMFDAGGYHLKSIDGMNGMKYDMCGAAGILETMEFLAKNQVKKNLVAVLMLAENVISPDAVKMGDVITMLSGNTVEVYNTDAEGRLVLADGLTYVQRAGAEKVVDLATLTYGAQSALGDATTALFVNQDAIEEAWKKAAALTGERFWRLPVDETYHQMLLWSQCADFANYAPGKGAAASTAASFLENFIEEGTQWVHLDMVGPSVNRSESDELAQGATGAGISTIIHYVEA